MRLSATALALLCSCVASIPSSAYPDLTKVFAGALPGDVPDDFTSDEEELRGYPEYRPPRAVDGDTLHGAMVQFAWQQTNKYARFWNFQYGLLNYRGEPKHGLWRWQLPGFEKPFWWCDVGLVDDDDEDISQGMEGLLTQIRKSTNVYVNGGDRHNLDESDTRLDGAREAGLLDLAIDLIPVTLAPVPGARVWVHTGDLNELYGSRTDEIEFTPVQGRNAVEVYIFTAYYDFGAGEPDMMFNAFYGDHPGVKECRGVDDLEERVCRHNVHTFVAVVFNTEAADGVEGFTGMGIHFAGDEGCPVQCGEPDADCYCDGVLVDLALDANLAPFGNRDWSETPFYVPAMYPGASADPEAEPEG